MNFRRLGSITLYVLFLTAILMAAGEAFARWKGFKAWSPQTHRLEILPSGGLYQLHPTRGYAGKPGSFSIVENDSVSFSVTRDSKGHRITHPVLALDSLARPRPQIWVFGCSFTHGWGVNDPETYPWLLQERFPHYEVVNFGMDGYGTLQSLMQLEEALSAGGRPELVILAYGSFHDQRNVLSRAWEKSVGAFDVLEGVLYPYIRFDSLGQVVEGRKELAYEPWPLQQSLAFVHYLETESNFREERQMGAKEITQLLLSQFLGRCHEFHIRSVLAGIYQQDRTAEVLDQARTFGIATVDMSLPPEDRQYRVSASDGHPNALAHQHFAQTLQVVIEPLLTKPPK